MREMTREEKVQTVHNLFIWLNRMSETKGPITIEDVAKVYTDDTVMTLNNRFICRGLEGQRQHSQDLIDKTQWFRFNLPFDKTIVEGDTVVGYYTCDFVSKEGVTGCVYDMCIWELKDGRIASILENVVFEGQQVAVESYD